MPFPALLLAALHFHSPLASPPTEAILAEGQRLYQSERSSWVATDLMLATTIDRSQIGGYLSYFEGDSVRTIFWAHEATGTVGAPLLASYTFPRQAVRAEKANYHPAGAFTAHEAQLFTLRATAKTELSSGKAYVIQPKTSLNLAFIEDKRETRVYVLTGPKEGGVVPIGNDYLLTFGPGGQLKSTERLHNSYLPMPWDNGKNEIKVMLHSHLEAHPYITPTDICSILLYRGRQSGRQHYVIGQKYVSLFDIDKQELVILTRQAFEKMANFKN